MRELCGLLLITKIFQSTKGQQTCIKFVETAGNPGPWHCAYWDRRTVSIARCISSGRMSYPADLAKDSFETMPCSIALQSTSVEYFCAFVEICLPVLRPSPVSQDQGSVNQLSLHLLVWLGLARISVHAVAIFSVFHTGHQGAAQSTPHL